MDVSITDLELSDKFDKEIAESYVTAVEFISSYPDYSLFKFREIIEFVTRLLAQKNDLKLLSGKLVENIDQLFDAQIIHKNTKDQLHEVRKLGNAGVHKSTSKPNEPGFYNDIKDRLKDSAKTARTKVVSIFEDVYYVLNKEYLSKKVSLVDLQSIDSGDILFQASISMDYESKLKAGILCQSIFEEQRFALPLIATENQSFHLECLLNNALSFYESSYKISANFHHTDMLFRQKPDLNVDEYILKKCQLEPLYRYASLAIRNDDIGEGLDVQQEHWFAPLKTAADRGYAPAEALFGAYLYDEKKYDVAYTYLSRAEKKDDVLALRYLFLYYSNEGEQFNKETALAFLNRAIDLGCPDSLAVLGEAYHKGILVSKDDRHAKELLEESIEKGSLRGKNYLTVEFNDLVGQITDYFQEIGEQLKKISNDSKPKPVLVKKIKPNELCPCGSKKKYKKCCRDKPNNFNEIGRIY